MHATRKDQNSIIDIMTKQDIIYSQTHYHQQGCGIYKAIRLKLAS